MRALVVVNHQATTMSQWVRDVLLAALRHDLKVEVAETNHRGHAVELGRQARTDGVELVIAAGGDGTVNEVVNGLLDDQAGPSVPDLAIVPAGSTNVFARNLGLPEDPVEAILNRTWRPALTVIGAAGFPSIDSVGNVLRPKTSFKLSMRIPPTVDAHEATRAMQRALTLDPPYDAKVTFDPDWGATGWMRRTLHPGCSGRSTRPPSAFTASKRRGSAKGAPSRS